MCKYQASGGMHFQFGHNWEVKLPVEKKRKCFLNSLLNIAQLFCLSSSPLELNTKWHPKARERESSQAEGGGADQSHGERSNSRIK